MTHHIGRMIDAHPAGPDRALDKEKLTACIGACFECAPGLYRVRGRVSCRGHDRRAHALHRTDLDCAEICAVTGSVLSRQTGTNDEIVMALLETCRTACRVCAEECKRHAHMHEHCRRCAEACRRCESACAELAASLA